jgi:hypothetical protein
MFFYFGLFLKDYGFSDTQWDLKKDCCRALFEVKL